MVYKNFDELMQTVRNFATRKRVAVVVPEDEHTLEAVFHAAQQQIVEPIFVGDAQRIKSCAASLGHTIQDSALVHVEMPAAAAYRAIELIKRQEADFLMKGKLDTAVLLKAVVDRERGLRSGRLISHVAFHELPTYHKLLAVTDGGMILHPHLDEKKSILENAVSFMTAMGYDCPKVAVLAAVEKVNPKMQETVDAAALKAMNQSGKLENCLVEGPISYDLAMSKESAQIKGYESPVTGDVDIMLVPNIATGNILGKSFVYSGRAKMAGVIVGAKVPIVLTSRGASAEEKLLSLILSASAA